MKNIKDIVLSIFAVIGFIALLSSFTTEPKSEISYGTPESHVWTHVLATSTASTGGSRVYLYNKVTGEMRKYSYSGLFPGEIAENQFYQVMIENKKGETAKVLRERN